MPTNVEFVHLAGTDVCPRSREISRQACFKPRAQGPFLPAFGPALCSARLRVTILVSRAWTWKSRLSTVRMRHFRSGYRLWPC